jgi:hypothetical protein
MHGHDLGSPSSIAVSWSSSQQQIVYKLFFSFFNLHIIKSKSIGGIRMTQEQYAQKNHGNGENYEVCRGCGTMLHSNGAYNPDRPVLRGEPAVFCVNGNGNGSISKCAEQFSREQGPVLFYKGLKEAPVSEISDAVEHVMRQSFLRP